MNVLTKKEIFLTRRGRGFIAVEVIISKGERTKEEGDGGSDEDKGTHFWGFVMVLQPLGYTPSGGILKGHLD